MQFVNSWKYIQKLFGKKTGQVLCSFDKLSILACFKHEFSCHNSGLPLTTKLKIPWLFTDLVYIHFTFFCRPSRFFSSFSISRGFLQKEEEGIWKKAFTTKTTNRFVCFAAYFSSSSSLIALFALQHTFHLLRKKMPFEKLMDYKPENRIPLLFTDFDNIKDFPWHRKIFVFPWPW